MRRWTAYITGGITAIFVAFVVLFALAKTVLSDHSLYVQIQTDAPLGAVYFVKDPGAERSSAQLIYPVGEADMTGSEGIAHYTEHLVVMSALPKQKSDLARDFNAWTSKVVTNYFMTSQSIDEIFSYLAATIEPVQLSQDFMQEEAGIVLSEFSLNYSESPLMPLQVEFDRAKFQDSTLARQPIGDPGSVRSFQPGRALSVQRDYYRLEDAVLVVYSPHSRADIRKAIDQAFAGKSSRAKKNMRSLSAMKVLTEGTNQKTLQESGIVTERHITSYIAKPIGGYSTAQIEVLMNVAKEILNSSKPKMFQRFVVFEKHDYANFNAQILPLPENLGFELNMVAAATEPNLPYLSSSFDAWVENIDSYQAEIDEIWQEFVQKSHEENENWTSEEEYHYISSQIYSGNQPIVSSQDFTDAIATLDGDDAIIFLRHLRENSRETSRIWRGREN